MTEDTAPDSYDFSRESNEIVDRLDRLNNNISKLLTKEPPSVLLDLYDSRAVSQHTQFRATHLVITVSAAATVSLSIGTATRSFEFVGAGTIWLPFPVVIGRAVDIVLTTSAGTCYGYLVGRSE